MNVGREILPVAALIAMLAAGCGGKAPEQEPGKATPPAGGSKYLLSSEPEGARDVLAVLETAKDDEEIVVVGRIGGDEKPFVQDLAAFTIVDRSLKPCNANPEDNCQTPWDYCCEADLAKARTAVRVVDGHGNIVATGAKELLGLKPLDTVVVQGKAKRDPDGKFTLLATGLYVRP
jgi:hypothetical protein